MTLSMKPAVAFAQLLEIGIGQLLPNLAKDFWRPEDGPIKRRARDVPKSQRVDQLLKRLQIRRGDAHKCFRNLLLNKETARQTSLANLELWKMRD